MIYYELVEKTFSDRGNVVPVTKLSFEPRDFQAYISLFGYGDEIQEWLELNDSVKGYNGELFLQTLYFDIDRSNLEEARKDTLRLLKHLYNNYGASPKELELFFSGGKGFHVGIPGKLFGGFEKSSDLPEAIDTLASLIAPENIKGIDLTIYNVNRIFRVPHSKHQESGMFKVPLYLDELKDSVDAIKEIAEYPRPEFEPTVGRNDLVVNDALRDLWHKAKHQKPSKSDPAPKDSLRDGNFFKPPESGERNNKLFKQAAMLFDKGLDSKNVYDIITSINASANPPIDDEDEIYTIVQSARRKTGATDNQNDDKVVTEGTGTTHLVSDLVPSFLEYLSPSQRKLGLLFNEFSEDIRWKLRGKLIGVVGREGTKKSLFCQNLAYKNMKKYGARTIVSNMEMGDNALMARIIDRSFSKYRIRPSDDMERAIKEGKKGWVKDRLHLLSKHYGDKLLIDSSSAMTPKDYAKIIQRVEKKRGKVDMLVIDGFSMMGGNSDRFKKQEENSRKLKEIAKHFDVAILPIFHTNASAEKYWRKAHDYIRGSNKQKDNIDAFISLSLIVDKAKSNNPNDLRFFNDIGYALMYNKRGTGNTIRKIFNFNSERLSFESTNENPEKYEVNVNRL